MAETDFPTGSGPPDDTLDGLPVDLSGHAPGDVLEINSTNDGIIVSPKAAPGLHASTHELGGPDELALDGAQITAGTIAVARLPTNVQFANDLTSGAQAQLNGKQSTLTLPLSQANGGLGNATGDASGLNNIPAGQLTGDVALARIATSLAAGGGAVKGTVVTATTRVDAPSIGTDSSNQHALGTGTGALLDANSSLPAANVTGILPRANGGTASATGDLVATNQLTSPILVSPSGSTLTLNGLTTGVNLQFNSTTIAQALTGGLKLAASKTLTADTVASNASTNLALNANGSGGTVFIQSNGTNVLSVGGTNVQLASARDLFPGGDQSNNIGSATLRFAQIFTPVINAGATFLTHTSNVSDGASVIGHKVFNTTALANATAKIVQFGSNAVEKAAILASGSIVSPSIGTSTSTLHALPSGTDEILAPPRGTAGQVLTSLGAGSAPAMADPVTLTTGSATLGSTFLITGASGVYQDTGLSLSLPATGRYLLIGRVLGNVNVLVAAPGFISVKFYNATAAADVANSTTVVSFIQVINQSQITTAPVFAIIDIVGAATINLYAARNLATTYNASEIDSSASGYTQISYIRIG